MEKGLKVIVIESGEDRNYVRGHKCEIQKYIEHDGIYKAIVITDKGLFKIIPLHHLGKGHELRMY